MMPWSLLGNAVFAEGEGGESCCLKSQCFIVKETATECDSLPAVCFRSQLMILTHSSTQQTLCQTVLESN